MLRMRWVFRVWWMLRMWRVFGMRWMFRADGLFGAIIIQQRRGGVLNRSQSRDGIIHSFFIFGRQHGMYSRVEIEHLTPANIM